MMLQLGIHQPYHKNRKAIKISQSKICIEKIRSLTYINNLHTLRDIMIIMIEL
jgi:hypothetical protein